MSDTGRDDLFQNRMKLEQDFSEYSMALEKGIHNYLLNHSANFRRLNGEHEALRAAMAVDLRDYSRLIFSFFLVMKFMTERFWPVGMIAAVRAAAEPDFDMTGFLREHAEISDIPEYLRTLGQMDAAYEAAAAAAPQYREELARDREVRREELRYHAAACAMHGFEWADVAQQRAGFHVEQPHVETFYRFLPELL